MRKTIWLPACFLLFFWPAMVYGQSYFYTNGNANVSSVASAPNSCTTNQFFVTSAGLYYCNSSGVPVFVASSSTAMSIGGTVTGGTGTAVPFIDTGPVLAQDATYFTYDKTTHTLSVPNFSGNAATSNALYIKSVPNDGSTATVAAMTACKNASGNAQECIANAVSKVLGVVTEGAGTTGNPTIATTGTSATATYDATPTVNHWAITSATPGQVVDSGSTVFPTCGNEVVGLVNSTTTVLVMLQPLAPCPSNANQSWIANSTTGWQPGTPPLAATATALATAGTTTTVLHGNASGAPSYAGVSLSNDTAANQGTTTTVLHGNGSGQPSFGGVSLANDTVANQGTTTTVLHGNAAGQPSFGATVGDDFGSSIAAGSLFGNNTGSAAAPGFVTAPYLGVDGSTAGTLTMANSAGGGAHTVWGSGATTTNTILGFTAVPTTGHLVTCTVSGTTCTFTDGGAAPAAGANAALSNLSSVAINTGLLPGVTGTINLGSSTKTWANIYLPTTSGSVGAIYMNGDLYMHSLGGASNVFVGDNAGASSDTGTLNTGIGQYTFYNLTSGTSNTAVGQSSLSGLNSGASNTAVGGGALQHVTTGNNNTAVGDNANTGYNPANTTAIGESSLSTNSGTDNTALGFESGSCTSTIACPNTTGVYNVFIGSESGPSSNNLTNTLALGYNVRVAASNTEVIGNSSVTDVYFGSTTPSANVHLGAHISSHGTAPGITGTGCSISGNDTNMIVTNSGVGACAVTFHAAFTAPVCTLGASAALSVPYFSAAVATTGYTLTVAAADTVNVHCEDIQ